MRDTIRNKIKLFFAFLIILFLLPYIISVFINGKNAVQGADSDNASVYLAEMLAGETDGGYEGPEGAASGTASGHDEKRAV
mgnify:CR=1 FL=1